MEWKKIKRFIKYFGIFLLGFFIILIIYNLIAPEEPIGEKVALIEINGPIYSSRNIIEQIHKYKDNESVKAIVLRIDSPGGIVAPTQEIYKELTKVEKNIVVSMGSIATSGAYYIACAGDRIFANPGTLTGSIGVILRFPNIEELSKKIGIGREVIKSGNYKDSGSMYRKLTPEEKKIFQDTVDDVYAQFIDVVLEGRKNVKLTRKQIEEIADGRVLSGRQAFNKKLVDELGDLDDAIEYAGKVGGIEGKPKVFKKKERKSLFERIIGIDLADNVEQILKDQISIRYEFSY